MSSWRLPSATGKRSGMFSKRRFGSTSTMLFRRNNLVRREVMDAFEQSVARNRDLLQRLAK